MAYKTRTRLLLVGFVVAVGFTIILALLRGGQTDQSGDQRNSNVSANASENESDLRRELFDSVNNGDTKAVRELCLRGVDVNVMNADGLSPLQRAATKGHVEIAELLLDNGALIDQQDVRGWTALHIAAMKGRCGVVRLLIARQAQMDKKDKLGKTPLDWAVERGHKEAANILTEHLCGVPANRD